MKKYTIAEISGIIEEEKDLAMVITDYINPGNIKDDELSSLWEEAKDVLIRLQEYIDNNIGLDGVETDEDEFDDYEN